MHFKFKTNNTAYMILISCAYFFLFLPPNLTGAKDPNMLAVFQIDEYAQYPFVINMTSAGTTFLDTILNFIFYGHYFYGYPFYLISAILIMPFRVVFGGGQDAVSTYMAVLRQMSPLFMIVAINILIYMWTEFKSLWRSILLFLFLVSIPAVFDNNMWWHPESLVMLFIVLTIFSLYKDNLEYGIWFQRAGVFCGLATGTKTIGLWFFLTVAVYLSLGFHKIGLRQLLKHAVTFFILMILTIIISNPLLILPQMAKTIFGIQVFQAEMNNFGWGIQMSKGPAAWYAETLKIGFGYWWIYAVALGICVWNIRFDHDKRMLNIIILTWFAPLSLYLLFFVANKAPRYFLPTLLPLLSCIGSQFLWNIYFNKPRRFIPFVFGGIILVLFGLQLTYNLRADIESYLRTLHRQQESPALEFYRQLDQAYFQRLPQDTHLNIFRDPYLYLPPSNYMNVKMKWGTADYEDIEAFAPDLIILQQEFIMNSSDPSVVSVSFDQQQAEKSLLFYQDAKNNTIKNYHQVFETPFGVVFERNK